MLTYDFRLPPGPRTVEYAVLAENLGFRAVWCPEIPAFGHDIWVTLARIAEKTKHLKFGPSVLIPSYRHPMAQVLGHRGRLEQVGAGMSPDGRVRHRLYRPCRDGQEAVEPRDGTRTHITQVKALLRGDIADIDGGLARNSRVRTAGCSTVRSTCWSTWRAKDPRPACSPKRLPTV